MPKALLQVVRHQFMLVDLFDVGVKLVAVARLGGSGEGHRFDFRSFRAEEELWGGAHEAVVAIDVGVGPIIRRRVEEGPDEGLVVPAPPDSHFRHGRHHLVELMGKHVPAYAAKGHFEPLRKRFGPGDVRFLSGGKKGFQFPRGQFLEF